MDVVNAACNGALSDIPGANVSLANLINTFFATQCSLFAADEYPDDYGDQLKDGDEFDFIVIGAGSAGSVVANRLSENPRWKILLIEAGGDPKFMSDIPTFWYASINTTNDWNYTVKSNGLSCLGMIDGQCVIPRGKTLGGSSSLNTMYYVRGNPKDFDEWEAFGNPGWSYSNVLKYFIKQEKLSGYVLVKDRDFESANQKPLPERRKNSEKMSEKYHSTKGLQGVSHFGDDHFSMDLKNAIFGAAEELGFPYVLDINGKSQMGFTENQGSILYAKRADTAKMYLNPVKDRPNLFVAKHTIAQKLLLKDKTVTGVECIRKGDKKQVFAKNEVIVSAGAIESPKLLLLSGIGPRDHLESVGIPVVQDLKGVGENLQDHYEGHGAPIAINEKNPPKNPQLEKLISFYQYLTTRNGTFSTIGIDIIGFINTLSNASTPDIEYEFRRYWENDAAGMQSTYQWTRLRQDVLDKYIEINRKSDTLIVMTVATRPKSKGYIRLRSKDPNDPPIVFSNFLHDDEDVETMIRGYNIADKLSQTAAFRNLEGELMELKISNCSRYGFRTKEYWECVTRHTTISGNHPSCTCKMGPKNDTYAVVDSKLKVHGINNLRVVDASIMPIIVRGNINAAVIMIGEKASDMIKSDYSSGAKTTKVSSSTSGGKVNNVAQVNIG